MVITLGIGVLLVAIAAEPDGHKTPIRPYESQLDLPSQGRIDELVFGKLKDLGLQPAFLCSDEVFLRRAYLDVIGTLPTPEEVTRFLKDHSPRKRRALIDRLLERDEFADYWAMKWSDLLRIKAEFPINLWPNAAQGYHRWVRTCLKENMPYDQFVRELLTASGSNFRVPQVNFARAMQNREPQGIAQTVALTFMGMRAETWPKDRLAGMAAFFSKLRYKSTAEWKEEVLVFDPSIKPSEASSDVARVPIFPDGKPARIAPDRDPREAFADWLVAPENPYFARNIVNRIWFWLMGRGIVHEPDDFRDDNPPSNPELLAYLEHELIASHYDLKHVYRLILNSKAYQLSSISRTSPGAVDTNFAHYPVRRLDAEVLIDAINQVTGTTETYTSPIPEPFTFIPEDMRAIALPDGSISSPFLELFGRPPRDTGFENERNNRATASQRLHLLNSTQIRRKLEQSPKIRTLIQSSPRPRDVVEGLYILILSRPPTEAELGIVTASTKTSSVKGREFVLDLAWSLINGSEFLYRH